MGKTNSTARNAANLRGGGRGSDKHGGGEESEELHDDVG